MCVCVCVCGHIVARMQPGIERLTRIQRQAGRQAGRQEHGGAHGCSAGRQGGVRESHPPRKAVHIGNVHMGNAGVGHVHMGYKGDTRACDMSTFLACFVHT